jgi:hypothetical protein
MSYYIYVVIGVVLTLLAFKIFATPIRKVLYLDPRQKLEYEDYWIVGLFALTGILLWPVALICAVIFGVAMLLGWVVGKLL